MNARAPIHLSPLVSHDESRERGLHEAWQSGDLDPDPTRGYLGSLARVVSYTHEACGCVKDLRTGEWDSTGCTQMEVV